MFSYSQLCADGECRPLEQIGHRLLLSRAEAEFLGSQVLFIKSNRQPYSGSVSAANMPFSGMGACYDPFPATYAARRACNRTCDRTRGFGLHRASNTLCIIGSDPW